MTTTRHADLDGRAADETAARVFTQLVVGDVRLRRHVEGRDLQTIRGMHARWLARPQQLAAVACQHPAAWIPTTPDGDPYPPADAAIVATHLQAAVEASAPTAARAE